MAMSEGTIGSTSMTEEALDAWENITYDWELVSTEFSFTELSDPTEP